MWLDTSGRGHKKRGARRWGVDNPLFLSFSFIFRGEGGGGGGFDTFPILSVWEQIRTMKRSFFYMIRFKVTPSEEFLPAPLFGHIRLPGFPVTQIAVFGHTSHVFWSH